MKEPLISIIIPTFDRPQYLPRAVESALSQGASCEVEVIVVPNGPSTSWRKALNRFMDHPSLQVEPINTAHANVARNLGLELARGKYIRFLDDDDFLLPENACKQADLLNQTGAEICSGLIKNVDADLSSLGILSFPETSDFVAASLSLSGFLLPVGNLFRRSALTSIGAAWREDLSRAQDLMWMIDLARQKEWNWVHLPKPVGVWFQHDGNRLSTMKLRSDKPIQVINTLFDLHEKLIENERMTDERSQALTKLLWHYVHSRFPFDMIYWTHVARKTLKIAPESRPDHDFFNLIMIKHVHPLLLEIILAIPRKITRFLRDTQRNHIGWDYRRRL